MFLLCYSGSCELADQGIEPRCLLILELLAGIVEHVGIDTRIYALESLAYRGCWRYVLAPPDRHDRHLQTSQGFVDIHMQVAAQQGGCRETTVRLVRTAEDVLYYFVGDQARVVIALAIIVAFNCPP